MVLRLGFWLLLLGTYLWRLCNSVVEWFIEAVWVRGAEAAAADHAQVAAEAAGPYGGLGILDRWAHAFPAREPPPFDEEPEVDCVRAWSDPLDALWHADV